MSGPIISQMFASREQIKDERQFGMEPNPYTENETKNLIHWDLSPRPPIYHADAALTELY